MYNESSIAIALSLQMDNFISLGAFYKYLVSSSRMHAVDSPFFKAERKLL